MFVLILKTNKQKAVHTVTATSHPAITVKVGASLKRREREEAECGKGKRRIIQKKP